MSVKKTVYGSMCVALAAVTSLIRLYSFPFGGSVTLCSMLFAMLPAWLFGTATGITAGLVYGLLQFFLSPYFISVPQFLFDYVLAFSVMGAAGFLRNTRNGLITGYLLAVFLRWIMAVAAGMIWIRAGMLAWEGWSPLPYSMVYNGIYLAAEAVVTVPVLMIPAVKNALIRIRESAHE